MSLVSRLIPNKFFIIASIILISTIYPIHDSISKERRNINYIPHDYEITENTKRCMIRNVFYESPRINPHIHDSNYELNVIIDRIHVINVMLNRLKSEKYPDSICEIVNQNKQFSWTINKIKNNVPISKLYKNNEVELYNLKEIQLLVEHVIENGIKDVTKGATHYHAKYVSPSWNKSLVKTSESNWHIYYK